MKTFTIDQVVGLIFLVAGIITVLAVYLLILATNKKDNLLKEKDDIIRKQAQYLLMQKRDVEALSEALDNERAWNDMLRD